MKDVNLKFILFKKRVFKNKGNKWICIRQMNITFEDKGEKFNDINEVIY